MIRWHWDQGRSRYFQFNNLRIIAESLLRLDGVYLNTPLDPLRVVLEAETGLPFAPMHYKVWRNYKRVFECAMLATNIDNKLHISDFCRLLASDNTIGVDEYLSLFIPRFRFPFPAFSDFSNQSKVIFPFCAIIKFLIAKALNGNPVLTVEEIFSYVIGNECEGTESIEYYLTLQRTSRKPDGDEERQVREMLAFVSQMSIFKWYRHEVLLDVQPQTIINEQKYSHLLNPKISPIENNRSFDFIKLTNLSEKEIKSIPVIIAQEDFIEESFTEGKRVRITHTKIERSPLLRKIYFSKYPKVRCNMCNLYPPERYPWVDNILEIHHILPLSSGISYNSQGTTFDDVVPLCPNCHRVVHGFYRNWLNLNRVNDFRDRVQAVNVFNEAKKAIKV